MRISALTFCTLLTTTALASPALAQSAADLPPIHRTVDDNGVDLVSGFFRFGFTEAALGSGEGAISLQRYWAPGYRDNWSNGLYLPPSGAAYVTFGDISDKFQFNGSVYVSQTGNGATLVLAAGLYTYTAADGTQIVYRVNSPDNGLPLQGFACVQGTTPGQCGIPISLTKPNGMTFTINWAILDKCSDSECTTGIGYYKFTGVSSAAGYSFVFSFAGGPGTGPVPNSNWYVKTGATFANSVTACTSACPSLTYTYGPATTTITDNLSRQWILTQGSGQGFSIRRPGDASATTVSTGGGTGGSVASVANYAVTSTYSRAVVGSTATTTITDPLGKTKVVVVDLTKGVITSVKDELNRTTAYQYDANGRMTRVTMPEGNYAQIAYDSRGNVLSATRVAKTGSGLPDSVTSATFPASCTNQKTCNQPTATTDARGKVTDYTYDSNHGGVLTVTAPAPTTGAVRPKTTVGYTLTAAPAGLSVYLPTSSSTCQTLASCANGADEARTVVGYGNNLLPTSVTRRNGTGTLTSTTTATYDPAGNLLTTDGPLAGTGDTTRYRYDGARRLIGTVGPDPDGGGALKHRAVRLTLRPDSQASKQELGTVNSQSDPDWAAFAPLETVDITFDANSRLSTQKLSGSAGAVALTQFNYDSLGRSDCVATRMNPAIYGSLPASACSLGTQGSNGPDRIAQTVYDFASQVTQNKAAVGTADAATERTLTYTNNGKLATLKDAENNLTTYEYDGHDRLSKTRFPDTTKGSGTSSTTDYEQLTYENTSSNTRTSGTVATFRNRANETTSFAYDNLTRLTTKNLPGTEPDVTYAYDNLNRLTSASQTGASLSFTYDALSRNLTQVGPQGTVTSTWDAADRRLTLAYPGSGLTLNYDYLVTGETDRIRENGAVSGIGVLADYAYDNLLRRTSVAFGNGTSAAYAFDPVSRLTTLTNELAGTTHDLTIGSIAYNPASQITSQVRSNDLYAWTGHGNGSTASVANGLNQLTSIGGAATAHDAKGNLTSDPVTGKTYTYSSENLLTSASGGVTLAYDPMLRLRQVAGAATTRFAYDGSAMIAEYDGADALQRRFVHGPGVDEPIVQYEGADLTTRRWLHADERGSVVAISDASGNMLNINTYDEYGKPGASNAGRFQYTGQAWLPELSVYYYKARMYDPRNGRFLQPDPIGYDGGMNIYAYVGNDPVNYVDPLGLQEVPDPGGITVTGQLRYANTFCENNVSLCGSIFEWPTFESPGFGPFEVGGGGSGEISQCATGLEDANKDDAAIFRANQNWSTLSSAASGASIPTSMLAAIAVRETGFLNIPEAGGGGGRGVFQITGNGVSNAQAYNIGWSARWTAQTLSQNMRFIQSRMTNVASSDILRVTAMSHNLNIYNPKIRDMNANQIESRTTGANYGSNIVDLMDCFSGAAQ